MSRFRLLLISLLVVVGVNVVASSSASAAFKLTTVKCEGTLSTVCDEKTAGEGLKEVEGAELIANTKLVSGTKSILAVAGLITIACGEASATGELSQPEVLVKAPTLKAFFITFKSCTITAEPEIKEKCTVIEPIKTKELTVEVLPTEPEHIEIKPTSGKIFTEIEIGNKSGFTCPSTVKGVNPVKATEVLCMLPKGTEDKTLHIIKCIKTEGDETLEFGTNKATFEAEAEFGLESGTLFDIALG